MPAPVYPTSSQPGWELKCEGPQFFSFGVGTQLNLTLGSHQGLTYHVTPWAGGSRCWSLCARGLVREAGLELRRKS